MLAKELTIRIASPEDLEEVIVVALVLADM